MKYCMMFMMFTFFFFLLARDASYGNDQLGNRSPSIPAPRAPLHLGPGAIIRLPDGRQTRILHCLPDGSFQTAEGVIITAEGYIPDTQQAVVVMEAAPVTTKNITDTHAHVPGSSAIQENVAPDDTVHDQSTQQLTLAELLPTTPMPQAQEIGSKPKQRTVAPKKEKPLQQHTVPAAQPKIEKKEEKRVPPQKSSRKPRIGEELHIPPDAAKSGNLDFLEGCWQGTRPEYFSKRTIRECFCFGANGKNGKRRVFDPSGGRMCIGATSARLGNNGVLSVTSSGAACTDGERWGQAEMICRGKGQRTPCSWVFKDANGGRQSYEIPFVRVESCRRK
ncbi:MAG: hypothetical protein IJU37_05710 [Desulfovibrio sp.]|nr:hypothetical protein [Desulfovibrio sp.]